MEEPCKTPNVVSLNGNVIYFHLEPRHKGKSELTCRCFTFERGCNRFVEAATGAASASASVSGRKKTSTHGVDIVACTRALHVQKRVTSPCVLVSQGSARGHGFLYRLLTLHTQPNLALEPSFEFELPYQINGTILRGPTVLWSHAGQVFYTSPQAAEVRQVPFQLAHVVHGELPDDGQVFVMGMQTDEQPSSQTMGYFPQSGQAFDASVILPRPYIGIASCLLVLSAETVAGVLKTEVVAATSYQQLVYIHNGIVKDTCPLPFQRPQNVQLVNTGRNGCLFVVSFDQGHVCAVWKETFQIASQWSDVMSVHVDDFLGCGTDQILLLFKDDDAVLGRPLEHFLITDLCGISYSHGQISGVLQGSSPPPEKNLLTLKALESRLQSGLMMLQELQAEVRVKDRVVQQAVQALADVVSEREATVTQPEEEGLVALWESDDESKDEASLDKTQDMSTVSPKPQIDKLWHRVAGDQIVVGVILTTDSSIPVASVSLSILTETGQCSAPAVIQTQSQVLWLPTPCPSSSSSSAAPLPEPAAKRSKQQHPEAGTPNDRNTCRMAVTAVTRLTCLLNSGSVKCRVMLHYVQRQEAFSLLSSPTPFVLHCGQVSLDIHGHFQNQLLTNPQLKTDEAKEDLLSLLSVLEHRVFHIDSPDHSLGDLDGWIQRSMGCERIEVSPQYLLTNSAGPSAPMLLRWHQITPFQGELSVHSSQLQMLWFLDSFLDFLPSSCSVRPVSGTGGQNTAQVFSVALQKEVVSLRDCVSMLLHEDDDGRRSVPEPEETPDPSSVEGLQRCRLAWQREVERSRMRLSPLVDAGRYRKLTQTVFQFQLDGDLAALLEIQRSGLC